LGLGLSKEQLEYYHSRKAAEGPATFKGAAAILEGGLTGIGSSKGAADTFEGAATPSTAARGVATREGAAEAEWSGTTLALM